MVVSPEVSTTYVVVVRDAVGRSAIDFVIVTVRPPLAVIATASTHDLVAGDGVTLRADISGGVAPYRCAWSDGHAELATTCELDVTIAAGTTAYEVSVRDAGNRVATAELSLETHPPLSVAIGLGADVVRGESVELTATVSGGIETPRCTWYDGGVLVGEDCARVSVAPIEDTVYAFRARSGRETFFVLLPVRVFAPLAVTLTPSVVQMVPGEWPVLTPSITGGIPPLQCRWQPDRLGAACVADLSLLPEGGPVAVSVFDAHAHAADASSDVRVLALVPIGDRQVVAGESLTLTGSATGLIGGTLCDWYDEVDDTAAFGCTITLAPTYDRDLTMTLVDSETQRVLHDHVHIEVAPASCGDAVQNGLETGIDCGGPAPVAWVNEVAAIRYDGQLTGTVSVELVVRADVTGPFAPTVYNLGWDGQSYVAGKSGLCRSAGDGDGYRVVVCSVEGGTAHDAALAITGPNGFLDFIRVDAQANVAAFGGPANGIVPRSIGVPVIFRQPELVPDGIARWRSECLVGQGDEPVDFTWRADCLASFEDDPATTGTHLDGDQTITGFAPACPPCPTNP